MLSRLVAVCFKLSNSRNTRLSVIWDNTCSLLAQLWAWYQELCSQHRLRCQHNDHSACLPWFGGLGCQWLWVWTDLWVDELLSTCSWGRIIHQPVELSAIVHFYGFTDFDCQCHRLLDSASSHPFVLLPQHTFDRWCDVRRINRRDGNRPFWIIRVQQFAQGTVETIEFHLCIGVDCVNWCRNVRQEAGVVTSYPVWL